MVKKKQTAREIGLKVSPPKATCQDKSCPFHGDARIRGSVFVGTVMSDRMHKTVTVQWERKKSVPKFERHERRKTRLHVHNPPCINANTGDRVRIAETRPLSKTKKFVVVEVLGKDIASEIKQQTIHDHDVRSEDKIKEEPKNEARAKGA